MYRILVGQFTHETNTFSPFPTGLECFRERGYVTGQAVIDICKKANTICGGHIQTLLRCDDVEIIPSVMASAIPSGAVTREAVETVLADMLAPIKGQKIDAVLLALHGAMCSELDDDADGYILEHIREAVGKDAVIAVTLDLHVNLSKRMLDVTDILIPFLSYPHSDMYERGLQTADLLMKTLRGQIHPVMTQIQIPLVPALIDTNEPPYAAMKQVITEQSSLPGVLYANMTHSFYMADTADTRASALVITDGDPELGKQAAQKIYDTAIANREKLVTVDTCTFEEAYEDAMKRKQFPVVFADVCDNPGAGGTCDAPHILKKLLAVGAKNALYGMIVDPESALQCHAAGVGATVTLKLGGKSAPSVTGEPAEVTGYVKFLGDGDHVHYGPMHTGKLTHLGKTAVVVIDGVTVVVASQRTQVYDLALFVSNGIDPALFDIIVMKSTIHYRAAVQGLSRKNYSVSGPSLYTLNIGDLHYQKLLPGTYPVG